MVVFFFRRNVFVIIIIIINHHRLSNALKAMKNPSSVSLADIIPVDASKQRERCTPFQVYHIYTHSTSLSRIISYPLLLLPSPSSHPSLLLNSSHRYLRPYIYLITDILSCEYGFKRILLDSVISDHSRIYTCIFTFNA